MMRVLRDWLLTPERAAVHLPTSTAVVADLHLGYAEARRRAGEAVPIASLEETLLPLRSLLERLRLRRLVVAGDILEDSRCQDALSALANWLEHVGVN